MENHDFFDSMRFQIWRFRFCLATNVWEFHNSDMEHAKQNSEILMGQEMLNQHVLMIMSLPICADLPASLLQKFNAASGNHSKKPQPEGVIMTSHGHLPLGSKHCIQQKSSIDSNHVET